MALIHENIFFKTNVEIIFLKNNMVRWKWWKPAFRLNGERSTFTPKERARPSFTICSLSRWWFGTMCGVSTLTTCSFLTRALFRKRKLWNFQHRSFCKGKKDRTVVCHIKELLGLLEFHPSVGHFGFVRRLWSSWAAIFPCSSLFIVQFLFLTSFSEVLSKRFQNPPGKCKTSWDCE